MKLLLARHGQTEWNAARRLQGRADLPLSAIGAAQGRSLRHLVAPFAPRHVVVSPLTRAVQTSRLAGHADAVVDDRWQEADLGEWTGRSTTALTGQEALDYADWRAGRLDPPGAECFAHMRERVGAAVDDILTTGVTTLVVTHGGPIRAACDRLVGLAPGSLVPVHPGSLTILELDGRPRLLAYNLTSRVIAGDPPD